MYKSSLFVGTLLGCAISLNVAATEVVLAKVNGQEISQDDYNNYVGVPPGVTQAPPNQPFILQEMINRELVVQEARRQGLEKNSEFLKQLETMKYNALFDFGMQTFFKKHPISEERLREEYKKIKPLKQYKARHILVKSQEQAQQLITQLKQGQNFAQLAMQNSMDPTSRHLGGDLGWLAPEQMFEQVAKAVITLSKGNFTTEPVQTNVGWHIVLLENTRELPPAPFAQVRGELMAKIQNQIASKHIEELKSQAQIEISKK